MIAVALMFLTAPITRVAAEDGGDPRDLVHFRQEIETLKGSEAAERRRVEQDEAGGFRAQRRRIREIRAREYDIAMAQAARKITRRFKPMPIEIERHDATARIEQLRKMSRLAARRRGAIDHGRAG